MPHRFGFKESNDKESNKVERSEKTFYRTVFGVPGATEKQRFSGFPLHMTSRGQ
jgi:hypothetical protein